MLLKFLLKYFLHEKLIKEITVVEFETDRVRAERLVFGAVRMRVSQFYCNVEVGNAADK